MRNLARKLSVWAFCVGFGAAYGAACGAIYGTLIGAVFGTLIGAVFGVVLGAFGGCVVGVIGLLIGSRGGWCLAAVLGGVVLGGIILELGQDVGEVMFGLMLIPGLIAAGLGVAVGGGLSSGRSSLPGVQTLAKIIEEASRPEVITKRPGVPTEVIPARAPEGRGDEVTPAG